MTNGFEKVAQQEARLAVLEQQVHALATRDGDLSRQIAEAHASGTGNLEPLTKQRREVREQLADIRDALPLLRETIARDREAAGREAAQARQLGIRRAYGSLLDQYERKIGKLQEAAAALAAAGREVNDTFRSLGLLQAEDSALADRFGLTRSGFAPVTSPTRHAGVTGAVREVATFGPADSRYLTPTTESNEHGARRRDYGELRGSPAFEIITQAGLKPFPPPTAEQVAARERREVAEREFADRTEGERGRALTRRAL